MKSKLTMKALAAKVKDANTNLDRMITVVEAMVGNVETLEKKVRAFEIVLAKGSKFKPEPVPPAQKLPEWCAVGKWVQPKDKDRWKDTRRAFAIHHMTDERVWVTSEAWTWWAIAQLEPYAPAPSDKVVVTLKDMQRVRGTLAALYVGVVMLDPPHMDIRRDEVDHIEPDFGEGKA